MTTATPPAQDDRAADARRRLERLQDALAQSTLDALLLSSRANFIYATGYLTRSWAMTARPLALVVTPEHCAAIVGSGEVETLASDAPHVTIREYTDPIVRELDGLVLADFAPAATRAIARYLTEQRAQRVGIEGSVPSASGLPYTALRELADELSLELVDAFPLLWKLRQRKTPYEIERLRAAGTALGRLYELFQARAEPGLREGEIQAALLAAAADVGADEIGYLSIVPRARAPAGRSRDDRWAHGELLYIDIGLILDGYWADFSRHFAANDAPDEQAAAYRRVAAAVRAGRAACRAGATAADVAHAIAAELPAPHGRLRSIGRLGHGLGLDLTEPPSLTPLDTTVLTPAMTLAVEPLGSFESGLLLAEENLVVTESAPQLLSPEFPADLPIVTR